MRDYKTVKGEAFSEFVEKKSRFLSYIAPVTTEAEATAFLQKIAVMHREAAHVVYAYSLLDGQIKRFSDAGEPQGTAGMPTLDVILRKDLYNVAIATVRYFGGILLGTGGLTRAYSKSASDAAAAAEIITRTWGSVLSVTIPYSLYGRVSPFLNTSPARILDSDFSDIVKINIFCPAAECEKIEKDLVELCAGSVEVQKQEEIFFDL